ncbi:FtsX-like permease family protein [Nonomuraea sp. NPDC050536]|uniref:FtsX-like permease family protein n=1 Tax=Nonomuraea sp. NPDC050536 TaxID=3364366 RepID=UPI0037C9C567
MLRLSFAMLRGRPGPLVGSFLALLFAVAMVTSCGLLMESALRAHNPPERYGASPVVVTGKQSISATDNAENVQLAEPVTLPAALAEKLRGVPGVTGVVPELTFPVGLAGVPGAGGRTYGHAWQSAALTPYSLRAGRAPAASGEVVVDAGLAARARLEVGGKARVLGRDGVRDYTVTGIAATALAGQSSVFFTAERAGELFARPGRVSAFGVSGPGDPERLKERIASALPGAAAYAGDQRGFAEDLRMLDSREMLVALSGGLAGVVVMVAVFVIAGTFGPAMRQREREIALLRAIGATPRQVRMMIGRESLLVGIVAAAAGAPLGIVVGGWLLGQLVTRGMLPEAFEPIAGPIPVLAAVAVGLAAAWLAARGSVRRATRIRPAEALGEAAVERRELGRGRVIAGLVFLALGLGAAGLSMSAMGETVAATAGAIVLFLVTAVALLGPWLVRLAAGLVGGVLRRASRVGGYLAVANTATGARRLASVVSPLVLMIAFAATTVFAQSTMGHAASRQAAEGNRADFVLESAWPGLPPEAARAARALPGVRGVTEALGTRVVGEYEQLGERTLTSLGAVGLAAPVHGVDLGVRAGSLDRLRGDGVALSTFAAGSYGAEVGDRVRLRLGDGTPVTRTVVAVYERGLGFGDVALPYEVVRDHSGSGMSARLFVVGGSKARLAGLAPGLTVLDRSDAATVRDTARELNDWGNMLALGLIIVFIAISVVNTLVMATGSRVREFALLRLVGGTRRQVLGMIRWEALLVGGIAVMTGTAIAAPTLMALSTAVTGSPLPYVPPAVYAAMACATIGLAFAATLLPARLALRGRPAERILG